jgi:acetyl esterase/lipase
MSRPTRTHWPDPERYHPLWSGAAPLQQGDSEKDVPAVRYFPATGGRGGFVVVCPGGGYGNLADHEGAPVARFLNSQGISAGVLRYRHGPSYRHPSPLLDVSRAIRTVRAHAADWGIDPRHVAVLGFSAGGHLASTVSTHFDAGDARAADPVERLSSRPDASVLVYPVITLHPPSAHTGSRKNLVGPDAPESLVDALSNDRHVTPETPPAFLFHTCSDPAVPVENALLYASALRRAGVAVELHVFDADAPHGVGLARDERHHPVLHVWGDLCVTWLKGKGF